MPPTQVDEFDAHSGDEVLILNSANEWEKATVRNEYLERGRYAGIMVVVMEKNRPIYIYVANWQCVRSINNISVWSGRFERNPH